MAITQSAGVANNEPLWKKLGYASYQDYIKTAGGLSAANTGSMLGVYGATSPASSSAGLERYRTGKNAASAAVDGALYAGGVAQSKPGGEENPRNDVLGLGNRTPPNAGVGSGIGTAASSGAAAGASSGASPDMSAGEVYQSNDFADWYRRNFGKDFDPTRGFSRPEGMSDREWEIGNALYASYLLGEELRREYESNVSSTEDRYHSAMGELDADKRSAEQSASIMLDKLMKYLPIELRAQGLGGLGMSESAALQAYNDYQKALGEIDKGYNSSKTSLENERNSTLTELQRNYQSDRTSSDISARDKVQDIQNRYRTEERQDKDALFNEVMEVIQSESFNTTEELENLINSVKGRVTDDQWELLLHQLEFYKNSDREQEYREELEEQKEIKEYNSVKESDISFNFSGGTMKDAIGDNFSVRGADNKVYRVENGGEEPSTEVRNAARNLKNGAVFGYGGQIYLKLNGKIFIIQKRKGASNSHSDYTDLYNEIYG